MITVPYKSTYLLTCKWVPVVITVCKLQTVIMIISQRDVVRYRTSPVDVMQITQTDIHTVARPLARYY